MAWFIPLASLLISGGAQALGYNSQRQRRRDAERSAADADALAMRDAVSSLEDQNLAVAQSIVAGQTEGQRQAGAARATFADMGVGGGTAQAILRDVAAGVAEFTEGQRMQADMNRRDTERSMRGGAQAIRAQLAGVPRASPTAALLNFAASGIAAYDDYQARRAPRGE